jgi:hypothetical protein
MGVKLGVRLRVFKNRVLRKIFGPKNYEVMSGENYITRRFMLCTSDQILFGYFNALNSVHFCSITFRSN